MGTESGLPANSECEFGEYTFFPESRKVVGPLGQSIKLTKLQSRVLAALAAGIGKPVAKENIYRTLYDGTGMAPDSKIIEVSICNFRTRLMTLPPGNADRHVLTIWGRGYELSHTPSAQDCRRGHRGPRNLGVRKRMAATVASLRSTASG